MNFLRYLCIGGTCTLVDFAIFIVFTEFLGYHYLLVSTASFSVAVLLNYYLCINHLFTSGTRFNRRLEILTFFAISTIGLLGHQTILYCLVDLFNIDTIIAKGVATISILAWNYLSRKCFVFRAPQFSRK